MSLNFSPLEQTKPSFWRLLVLVVKARWLFYLGVVISGLLALFVAQAIIVAVIALLLGAITLEAYAWQHNRLREFAVLNRFSYHPSAVEPSYTFYFSGPYRHYMADELLGYYNGVPTRVFTYGYGKVSRYAKELFYDRSLAVSKYFRVIPFRKGRDYMADALMGFGIHLRNQEFRHVTVLEMLLPITVPHFFVDSRHDGVLFAGRIDKKHRLDLEGTFHKKFNVYIAEEFHVEALDILTPDFMLALDQLEVSIDLEFIDNRMLIYVDSPKTQLEEYKQIFGVADTLMEVLNKKFEYWQFRPGKRTLKLLRQK